MLQRDGGRWCVLNMILSDLRCERITGHDAVTGDTGGAERAGIYTDKHHYSQNDNSGKVFVFMGNYFGELEDIWRIGHKERENFTVIAVFS